MIEKIKGFSLCSRLKLNTKKSLIFVLSPWKNKTIEDLDMKIERSTMNIKEHQLSIIDVDKSFLGRLQSELNNYIWGYKRAKMKRYVLIGENIQGRLKSIDIKSKI